MAIKTLRDTLLDAGIKNLKDYGYPAVDRKNILTDEVYKAFFKAMLEETSNQNKIATVQDGCKKLIAELS